MAKEYTHVDGEEGASFSTMEGRLSLNIEELLAAEDVRAFITRKAAELATDMIVGFETHKDNFTPVEGQ